MAAATTCTLQRVPACLQRRTCRRTSYASFVRNRGFAMLALLVVALALMGARAQSADAYSVMVSPKADRSAAVTLAGQSYQQSSVIYVFLAPTTGVRSVSFYLDDTDMSESPRQIESHAPFDFNGTYNGAAKGFAVGALPNGTHTITARVYENDGSTSVDSGTFSVSSSLRFEDNFSGSSVDTDDWRPWYSPGHAGNGLRRPSAITQSNGNLVITAKMVDGKIVSGGMAHRIDYTYGRFEFRVRTEVDPTGTMSGVVLTWPKYQKSPYFTENDIYETGYAAGTRSPFRTFIHYGYSSQKYYVHQADASDWHTMAMDWRPGALKIYRDGQMVWQTTDPYVIPDILHHLTIQLDARRTRTLTRYVRMYVDWVRLYS